MMRRGEVWGRNILGNGWGNDFARSAPGGKGIEDNDLVILEGRLELDFAVRRVSKSSSYVRQREEEYCIPIDVVDTHSDG
jgi:hypothetical protein